MAKKERQKKRADLRWDPIHGKRMSRNPRVPTKYKDERVKDVWRLICADLSQRGRLYHVLVHILEQYCDAYELYLAACDTLREEGATTKENYTEALRKHPMLQVRKDTIADMNTLEKKLGLTPYSRDRIEPADSSNKEEKRDPMAQFLNRKN